MKHPLFLCLYLYSCLSMAGMVLIEPIKAPEQIESSPFQAIQLVPKTSQVSGEVKTSVDVKTIDHQQNAIQSQQETSIGSIQESQILGQTNLKVRGLHFIQKQSGNNQTQQGRIGSIHHSDIYGEVNSHVNTGTIQQQQSGQGMYQNMDLGSVD